MVKALATPAPSVFFTTLQHCGALMRVLPELAALEGVPQRADYHPEVDSLVHTLMCVDVAARSGFELPVRYAALVHDLGKAKTPSRSEEHTSEHQSLMRTSYAVFCLKKKTQTNINRHTRYTHYTK